MKNYLIVLLAALLLVTLPVVAYATTEGVENAPAEGIEIAGPVSDAATEETPTEGENEAAGWFADAKAWLSEHFSGIVVGITALYTMFPKWGGLAMLTKLIKSGIVVITAFKKYMDDQNNPDSIYNVMARQGNTLVKFMNDISPLLERLEAQLALLNEATQSQDKQRFVMMSVEAAFELMAKEFSDLISISTTISQKQKAELEAEFMQAREHLHKSVKEALGDDGKAKETVA